MRPKKATHASQSTLFLIELIISVAFMALSSTVCVRLYLYAHVLSTESAFRTHAVTEVQNLFTAFRTGSGTPSDTMRRYAETISFSEGKSSSTSVSDALEGLIPSADLSGGSASEGNDSSISLTLFFDKDWNLSGYETGEAEGSPESAPYRLTLTFLEDADTPGMKVLTAEVQNDQINSDAGTYQTECRRYLPETEAAE